MPYRWIRQSLYRRVMLALVVCSAVVLGITTALVVHDSQERLKDQLLQSGRSSGEILAQVSGDALLRQDVRRLVSLARGTVGRNHVLYVAFYDSNGAPTADAAAFGADAAARQPFTQLLTNEASPSALRYRWTAQALEILEPVNSGSMSESRIGTVAIRFGTTGLQEERTRVLQSGILSGLTLIAALSIALGWLLKRLVGVPLQRLGAAAEAVSSGSWTNPLAIGQQDELGQVAHSFDQMVEAIHGREAQLEELFKQVQQELIERIRAAEALEDARVAAETANRAKSTFLANMSHELRTPLAAILGYADLLDYEHAALNITHLQSDIERIRTAGAHLLTLIGDILDISKIEAEKMEVAPETLELAPLLDDILTISRPLVEKKHNQLAVVIPPNLGTMDTDQAKLRQIVLNLLSNAAKFTEHGTITLAVSRAVQPDGDWLSFEVSDTGIGISEAHLTTIFQPFVQADASTTRKYGGTGLGLAISQRFALMMGGGISVRSTPGSGSTFTLYLPAQLTAPAALPPLVAPSAVPSTPMSMVLVIDDDANTRDMLMRLLSRQGIRVQSAATGEEGLRLARELRPDVITLDVLLPDVDGWTVLTTLKDDPELAAIPVLIVSMLDDQGRGFALGASDYLVKPITRYRLESVLQSYRSEPRPGRVLLAEDDPDTRHVTRRMLEQAGWEVSEAENGQLALQQLAEGRPDVILLDLMMPEMDGFGVVLALRQHPDWQHIPVIITTAKDMTVEDRARLSGTVSQVLHKGAYSRDELLATI